MKKLRLRESNNTAKMVHSARRKVWLLLVWLTFVSPTD